MILQCPSCTARFAVPDHLIPAEGRQVRCGRCSHQWHTPGPETAADPTDFAALASQAQEEYPEVNPAQLPVPTPEPLPRKPFMLAAAAIAFCWLIAAYYAYYPTGIQMPGLKGIYGVFGARSTEGLVFEDVSLQREQSETKTRYFITGSISNHSAEQRTVPVVRVVLLNAEGSTLWKREYAVNEPLAAGEPYAFRIDNIETSFGNSVASIALDLGHPLQLMMR